MTSPAPAPPRYRHVLVPLDGSRFAAAALPAARAVAGRFGADLHGVSVAETGSDVAGLRAHAAEALGVAEADDRVHVVTGHDPAAVIEQRAADLGACLVCLSTHGRGRVAGAVVGSVARSVLVRTGQPILAVGPRAGDPDDSPTPLSIPRLVACVDGSAASETVVPVAAAWADALGSSLTVVTVAEPAPPPVRADATWRRHHGPDGDVDEYLKGLAERWRDVAPGVATHVVWDAVGPADGLAAYLEEQPAGLVALTAHARPAPARAVLGASAAAMVHRAAVPTLVVPLTG